MGFRLNTSSHETTTQMMWSWGDRASKTRRHSPEISERTSASSWTMRITVSFVFTTTTSFIAAPTRGSSHKPYQKQVSSLSQVHRGKHLGGGYPATRRERFQKKLETFIGENGKYSVIGLSDSRRTSKVQASRREREEAGARCEDVNAPRGSVTTSVSASTNELSVAAGGRRSCKPPGFYRV